ncbi:hypothetical protein IKF89_00335 [Candidatus Saccharibacteria bacterium]|nr:hypothetical protein [Candidatus Saccharibacteria bacterium]
MSKLFRISGYFKQDESWGQTEPAFVGEIVMGELPIFWGCCKELGDGDTLRAGATSCLVGGFLKNRSVEFYFYKMYDNPPQDMLLCMMSDLENGRGVWATRPVGGGDFVERNLAHLKVEELPYSSELEREMYSAFNSGCPVLAGFREDLVKAAKARGK